MRDTAVIRLPEYRVKCEGGPGHEPHEFSIYRRIEPKPDEKHYCNQCRSIMQGKPQPPAIPPISLEGLLNNGN